MNKDEDQLEREAIEFLDSFKLKMKMITDNLKLEQVGLILKGQILDELRENLRQKVKHALPDKDCAIYAEDDNFISYQYITRFIADAMDEKAFDTLFET